MMQLAIAAQVIGSIFSLNLLIIILHTRDNFLGEKQILIVAKTCLGGSSSLSPATCGVSHIHAQHSIS